MDIKERLRIVSDTVLLPGSKMPSWMAYTARDALAEIERLEAENARLREGGGWLPIEGAPKSTWKKVRGGVDVRGHYLLGFCPEESARPEGCIEVIWWEPFIEGGCWHNGSYRVRPTHYRPLPSPPVKP